MTDLTDAELRSLKEIAKGAFHGAIPPDHGITLVKCGYAYNLLGHIRITAAGRSRLKASGG